MVRELQGNASGEEDIEIPLEAIEALKAINAIKALKAIKAINYSLTTVFLNMI